MELRHHDKVNENQRQGEHFRHLHQHVADLRALAGDLGGAARGQCQRVQLGGQLAGEQGGVVSVGGGGGDGHLAGTVLARNGRVAGVHAAGGKLAQRVGGLHLLAAVVHGGGGQLYVKQRVQRGHVGGVDDLDGVGLVVDGQGGGGGVGGQGGGDFLVDLRHGQPAAHRLVLVDGQQHFLVTGVLPVGDILNAGDLRHQGFYGVGGGAQVVQIVGVDIHLGTVAGQRAHVHHAVGVQGDFAVYVGGALQNVLLHAVPVGSAVIGQQNVEGHLGVVGGCVGAKADGGSHRVAAARHRAHGLHAVHARNGGHGGIGSGKAVGIGGVGGQGQAHGKLVGAHFGDHHNAHGGNAPHRHAQQHHGQRQRHGLAAQAEAQQLFVAVQHTVKQRVADLLGFFQHGGAGAGHHGQRHDQRRQQTEGDGPRHVVHQFHDHAGTEHQRQKYADGRQGGRDDAALHLPRTLHGGAGGGQAAVAQTVDVFNDNDRVVHQHTYAQRQTRKA